VHPFLSRLGDAPKGAKDWLNIAGTTAAILGGPESGFPEAALAKELTAPRPLTMPEPPRIPSAPRPSFAGPTAPPAVSQRFATEAVGSVTDPTRLGARGQGGVVVPQPKLLPESAPGRFAVPAQDNVVSKTNSFKLTPSPELHESERSRLSKRRTRSKDADGSEHEAHAISKGRACWVCWSEAN
jgi:hypothetical protein